MIFNQKSKYFHFFLFTVLCLSLISLSNQYLNYDYKFERTDGFHMMPLIFLIIQGVIHVLIVLLMYLSLVSMTQKPKQIVSGQVLAGTNLKMIIILRTLVGLAIILIDYNQKKASDTFVSSLILGFSFEYLLLCMALLFDRIFYASHQVIIHMMTFNIIFYKIVGGFIYLIFIPTSKKTIPVLGGGNDYFPSRAHILAYILTTVALLIILSLIFFVLLQLYERGMLKRQAKHVPNRMIGTTLYTHLIYTYLGLVLMGFISAMIVSTRSTKVFLSTQQAITGKYQGMEAFTFYQKNFWNFFKFESVKRLDFDQRALSEKIEKSSRSRILLLFGISYLMILPYIIVLSIYSALSIDTYKRRYRIEKDIPEHKKFRISVKTTLKNIIKIKMIFMNTISESPVAILAGLSVNIFITMYPGFRGVLINAGFVESAITTFNVAIMLNIWWTSLALWLTPFTAGLMKLQVHFESIYADRLDRILAYNRGHTIIVGSGDLGKQIIQRLVAKDHISDLYITILPSGRLGLIAGDLVVVDLKPDHFTEPITIRGLPVMAFALNNTLSDKFLNLGIAKILIPSVVGNILHSEIQSRVGFGNAGTIIGVPRNLQTSISLFDKVQSPKIKCKAILSLESSFNIPYLLHRTIRARLPVFWVHPDYLRGMNLAGMIWAAMIKRCALQKSPTEKRQVILICGHGKHMGYLMDNLLKILPTTRNPTYHDPLFIVCSDNMQSNFQSQMYSIDYSGRFKKKKGFFADIHLTKSDYNRMRVCYKFGYNPSPFRIVSFAIRKTSNYEYCETTGIFLQINPIDFPSMSQVFQIWEPSIIVLNYLDPIEQIRVYRTANNSILKWLGNAKSGIQLPTILIGAETGGGSRSQNVGDAYSRNMNLQAISGSELLPKITLVDDKILEYFLEYFKNNSVAPKEWSFPNRAGLSSEFKLLGDGMVDILEDPIEKIIGMHHSLNADNPVCVNICTNYRLGCLAELARRLSGIRLADQTASYNEIPSFFLTHVSQHHNERYCIYCLAYLVPSKKLSVNKPYLYRSYVAPAYSIENSRKKVSPFPIEDAKKISNLIWDGGSHPETFLNSMQLLRGENMFLGTHLTDKRGIFLNECPGTSTCFMEALQSHLLVLNSLSRVTASNEKIADSEINKRQQYFDYINEVFRVNRLLENPIDKGQVEGLSDDEITEYPFARIAICCHSGYTPGSLANALSFLLGQATRCGSENEVLNIRNIGVNHCHDKRFLEIQMHGNLTKLNEDIEKKREILCERPPISKIAIRPITGHRKWIEYLEQVGLSFEKQRLNIRIDWASELDDANIESLPFSMTLKNMDDKIPYCELKNKSEKCGFCPMADMMVHNNFRNFVNDLEYRHYWRKNKFE